MLERAPDDGEVLTALERLYRRADDKPALLDILQRRADLAVRRARPSRRPLRLQIGTLARRRWNARDDAVAAYERVLALKPGDEEAYNALDRLYTESKQWRRAVPGCSIASWPGACPTRTRSSCTSGWPRSHLGELGDREQALAHLGAALKLDQDHEPAISKLEELIADPDAQVAAADLLEPVYVRRNAWTQLVAIDELRLERSEDAQRRLALTQRIARVYEEQIEDLEAAFRWYGRLFRETPLERSAQEQLLRLAPKLDRWRDVADWFAPLPRRGVRRTATRCWSWCAWRPPWPTSGWATRTWPASTTGATSTPSRATPRRRACTRRRSSAGRPGTSCATCSRSTPAASPRPATASPTCGGAPPCRPRASAIGRAPPAPCASLLDIDPTDARAATDLEALLRADERWSDLREHLLWMLEQVSEMGGDLNGIAFRLAELEEQKLDDVERGGRALRRDPGAHAPARRAPWARWSACWPTAISAAGWPRSSSRTSAAPRSGASWPTSSRSRSRSIDDSDKRSARSWSRSPGIEEQLGRLDKALDARGPGLAGGRHLAPQPGGARAAGRRTGGCTSSYVEILRAGTERADDPSLQAALWAMIASLRGDPPGRRRRRPSTPGARPSPRAPTTRRPSSPSSGCWPRPAARPSWPRRWSSTWRSSATPSGARPSPSGWRCCSRTPSRNPDKAIEAWRRCWRSTTPTRRRWTPWRGCTSPPASGASWWTSTSARSSCPATPQSLRYLRFLSARVYEEKLEEADEAASQLRAVLDANPGDADALAMLDRIFTREKQHIELLEILDLRVAGAEGPDQDALAFRAAELVEKELDDTSGAIARYRDILSRSPGPRGRPAGAVEDRPRRVVPAAGGGGAGAGAAQHRASGPSWSSCWSCGWRSRRPRACGWRS